MDVFYHRKNKWDDITTHPFPLFSSHKSLSNQSKLIKLHVINFFLLLFSVFVFLLYCVFWGNSDNFPFKFPGQKRREAYTVECLGKCETFCTDGNTIPSFRKRLNWIEKINQIPIVMCWNKKSEIKQTRIL